MKRVGHWNAMLSIGACSDEKAQVEACNRCAKAEAAEAADAASSGKQQQKALKRGIKIRCHP